MYRTRQWLLEASPEVRPACSPPPPSRRFNARKGHLCVYERANRMHPQFCDGSIVAFTRWLATVHSFMPRVKDLQRYRSSRHSPIFFQWILSLQEDWLSGLLIFLKVDCMPWLYLHQYCYRLLIKPLLNMMEAMAVIISRIILLEPGHDENLQKLPSISIWTLNCTWLDKPNLELFGIPNALFTWINKKMLSQIMDKPSLDVSGKLKALFPCINKKILS